MLSGAVCAPHVHGGKKKNAREPKGGKRGNSQQCRNLTNAGRILVFWKEPTKTMAEAAWKYLVHARIAPRKRFRVKSKIVPRSDQAGTKIRILRGIEIFSQPLVAHSRACVSCMALRRTQPSPQKQLAENCKISSLQNSFSREETQSIFCRHILWEGKSFLLDPAQVCCSDE